jgi:hypothetical protein
MASGDHQLSCWRVLLAGSFCLLRSICVLLFFTPHPPRADENTEAFRFSCSQHGVGTHNPYARHHGRDMTRQRLSAPSGERQHPMSTTDDVGSKGLYSVGLRRVYPGQNKLLEVQ